MNKLKLLVIFMLILIVCLPFTQAQACAISLRKDDIGKVIDELKTKLPSDFSDEKMTYFIRRSFEKEFVKLSQSFGLDEEYPLSYIEYISDRPLEDLIISFNVLTELRNRYGITDEEIAEGIKNKNLLEVVRDKAEGDIENDITDIEEVKTSSERKNSVSSPFLVSSVLAMTLVLSTIIKSNVATNEAIGRELAMGSKASVSVVVNAPSTEVFQSEQKQEIIEDFIPAQEPEIQGAPSLEGDDYEKYNKIVPILNKVSSEMNFDPLILASIVLTESLGDANAKRHEENRYNQIKSAFQANPKYKQHYEKLKAENLVQTEEEYFQTMSSYDRGLTQIAPATAVAYTSWRGHLDELYNPETNLRVIIEFLRNRGFNDESDVGLNGAIVANTIVNTNSRTGTTVEGHIERTENYFEELETEFDLENKGIHCKKGSTLCFTNSKANLEEVKNSLYTALELQARQESKTIPENNDNFFKVTTTDAGLLLETDFEVDNLDHVEYIFWLKTSLEYSNAISHLISLGFSAEKIKEFIQNIRDNNLEDYETGLKGKITDGISLKSHLNSDFDQLFLAYVKLDTEILTKIKEQIDDSITSLTFIKKNGDGDIEGMITFRVNEKGIFLLDYIQLRKLSDAEINNKIKKLNELLKKLKDLEMILLGTENTNSINDIVRGKNKIKLNFLKSYLGESMYNSISPLLLKVGGEKLDENIAKSLFFKIYGREIDTGNEDDIKFLSRVLAVKYDLQKFSVLIRDETLRGIRRISNADEDSYRTLSSGGEGLPNAVYLRKNHLESLEDAVDKVMADVKSVNPDSIVLTGRGVYPYETAVREGFDSITQIIRASSSLATSETPRFSELEQILNREINEHETSLDFVIIDGAEYFGSSIASLKDYFKSFKTSQSKKLKVIVYTFRQSEKPEHYQNLMVLNEVLSEHFDNVEFVHKRIDVPEVIGEDSFVLLGEHKSQRTKLDAKIPLILFDDIGNFEIQYPDSGSSTAKLFYNLISESQESFTVVN